MRSSSWITETQCNMQDGPVPIIAGDNEDRGKCPVCGMAVRMERNSIGRALQYTPRLAGEDVAQVLPPQDKETAEKLKKLRAGKKTVALVGLAPTSCSLAPFEDKDVEIWALNETHAFPQWFKRWNRWFQIHESKAWRRYVAKRDVRGHYKWLQQYHYGDFESRDQPELNDWTEPGDFLYVSRTTGVKHIWSGERWEPIKHIYMQYHQNEIPNSVAYPLREVNQEVFSLFRRGDKKVRYYTSTFAYMMGIAIIENFDRIEIYGFEFSDDIEYVKQKACAEFWIGFALGRGIEVYTPPNNQIMWSSLYGGNEQGAGWW